MSLNFIVTIPNELIWEIFPVIILVISLTSIGFYVLFVVAVNGRVWFGWIATVMFY